MRNKICLYYQAWDLLRETPWTNSQTPQGHEDFRGPHKTPSFNYSSPYPMTPPKTIFIISAGRLMSFLTKINGQLHRRLCGNRDRASWETVCAFCDNIMFLDTWGWSMMGSDDGKWSCQAYWQSCIWREYNFPWHLVIWRGLDLQY